MAWNYAQLSHLAKGAGGPNALIRQIQNSGRNIGRGDMAPFILLAAIGGVVFGKLSGAIASRTEAKRAEEKKQAEAAMAELEKGIRDYDRENPDSDEIDSE